MISENCAKRLCKDDISRIENYDKAVSDTTQIWDCHHRLELTLDGEFAHTRKELIQLGVYYRRPYFELIFLTRSEHRRLHTTGKALSEETRIKMSAKTKHPDIAVSQMYDYKEYQKAYQRKYRLANPDYYKNRRSRKKEEVSYR